MRTTFRVHRAAPLPGAVLALLGIAGCAVDAPVATLRPELTETPTAAVSPPPSASVDQEQLLTAGPGANTLAIGGGSEQLLAQGFTVGLAGRLVGVSLPTGCSDEGVRVNIQGVAAGGEPDGTTRATGYLVPSQAPTVVAEPPVFVFIRTHPPISIAVGDQLAMVISSPGTCGILQGPVGDSYAGGAAYFDARPNTPGVWIPLSDFAGASEDLPFQTWVR